MSSTLIHTEGESNTSAARSTWSANPTDAVTKRLLDRDAEAFLHQSLSSVGGEATFRSGIAGPLLPGTEHVAPWSSLHCP